MLIYFKGKKTPEHGRWTFLSRNFSLMKTSRLLAKCFKSRLMLNSAVIEQRGFFSLPHLLYPRTSGFYGFVSNTLDIHTCCSAVLQWSCHLNLELRLTYVAVRIRNSGCERSTTTSGWEYNSKIVFAIFNDTDLHLLLSGVRSRPEINVIKRSRAGVSCYDETFDSAWRVFSQLLVFIFCVNQKHKLHINLSLLRSIHQLIEFEKAVEYIIKYLLI